MKLGIEHILTGWDHGLFVLLLVVVARRVGEVAGLITGFTIGHSITLALSALHVVIAFPRPVEAAIAASIVVVAVDNVWLSNKRRSRWMPALPIAAIIAVGWIGSIAAFAGIAVFVASYFLFVRHRPHASAYLRWPLACVFGLLHGFGFSRVLTEQSMTHAPALGSLFGFNVGVEIGQLGVVLLVWPALILLRQRGLHRPVVGIASAVSAMVATYALLVRALG